jgi:large subunit ribosomal protein L2
MPIKSFRPITPTLRFQTKLVNDDITTSEPYKPLLSVKPRTGGRNNMGVTRVAATSRSFV